MVQRNGLFRSRNNRMLGGVAAGLAFHLNTDPTLIRIIFLLLTIFWGGGLLLYIILWIALPEEDTVPYGQPGPGAPEAGLSDRPAGPENPNGSIIPSGRQNSALIIGLILIAVGVVFLLGRFIPRIDFGDLWPAVLVIAGVALIATSFSKTKRF